MAVSLLPVSQSIVSQAVMFLGSQSSDQKWAVLRHVFGESGVKFIGSDSTFSNRPEALSIVAFSQTFSGVITDELVVVIFGGWQAQQGLQDPLNMSCAEEIHSARHTSDTLKCIVMHDC